MRSFWGAALGAAAALVSCVVDAQQVDLELNFRVIGEVDQLSGGGGSVDLTIDLIDDLDAASRVTGQIATSGGTHATSGVFTAAALGGDTGSINNDAPMDFSFSVPFALEVDGEGVLDIAVATSSVLVEYDFSPNLQSGGTEQSTLAQGIYLESVTLAGGGNLIANGLQFEFIEANTELNASSTAAGASGAVVDVLAASLPSAVAAATSGSQASEASVVVDNDIDPSAVFTLYPDRGSTGGADTASASLLAVRETVIGGGEMGEDIEVPLPNVRLFTFVAAPADFDENGLIEVADYALWKSTFGDMVAAGEGADANGDGVVNAADYTVWRDAFVAAVSVAGASAPAASAASAAIPEPTTLTLAAALASPIGVRRRRG